MNQPLSPEPPEPTASGRVPTTRWLDAERDQAAAKARRAEQSRCLGHPSIKFEIQSTPDIGWKVEAHHPMGLSFTAYCSTNDAVLRTVKDWLTEHSKDADLDKKST
jgi:hypothetical protein